MGIKGLYKFIQKYAPSAIKELKSEDLQCKSIAFDTSIILYQFVTAIRNTGIDLTNKQGIITSHIHAIIIKTLSFLKKKFNPIYVFDGKPPSIKMDTLKERLKIRQDALTSLENDELDEETKIKLLKQSVVITGRQTDECKEILNLIGIPVINGLEEADSQCAYLSKNDLVDYVASEDMDLLTFGTKKLLRNINGSKIIEITLSKILEETGLTYNQFIDVCILLGCDYCPTINGIGMSKALILIQKYGSLDELIKLSEIKIGKKLIIIDNEFKEKYIIAKQYFLNPPIHKIEETIKWNKPDLNKLSKLLSEKYSYSDFTIQKIFKPLTGGYYKNIIDKNQKEILINNELNTHINILNIKIENDDLFIDDDEFDNDSIDSIDSIESLVSNDNIIKKNLII